MSIATFAGKTFQVSSKKPYTFSDFELSTSLNTETQDVEGKKPKTKIKGPGLDSMKYSIPLNSFLGIDPRTEYESWKSIMEKAAAYTFILNGKPVGSNKWLLKSVSLNDTRIDSRGKIIYGVLQIELEEYMQSGSGTVSVGSVNKESKKRTNKNKEYSIAKGAGGGRILE